MYVCMYKGNAAYYYLISNVCFTLYKKGSRSCVDQNVTRVDGIRFAELRPYLKLLKLK